MFFALKSTKALLHILASSTRLQYSIPVTVIALGGFLLKDNELEESRTNRKIVGNLESS